MRAAFQTGWSRAAAAMLACVLALACGAARADTAIGLFKSFAGNVNFVGTQKTMRTKANGNGNQACAVTAAATDISATLAGIPSTATVLSAQLYWAGSSSTADNTVNFDGQAVTAPVGRQYFSNTIGSGFDYFGGAVDVTAQVVAKRNATYKFSGLTIDNKAPYCKAEGVLGGFALLVVYSDTAEPFRVLNVYEGFQFMRYSALTLTLSNFRTPSPLGSATGRVAHITWEGDQSLGSNGEDLLFNGVQMFDTMNPKQNQFNSASNIDNDSASYGIDFDAYTVGSPALAAGQTSATSTYQAGQDLVLLNAEIIAVPNVPTADLSIAMTRNSTLVQLQNATYTLSVSNGGPMTETGPVVVTNTLPAGLSYVSASGTGWSCSSSGKVVTCSRAGSVAVGATLPALTLTVMVDSSGTQTNTASVAGQLFDNNSANNSASDSAVVTAPSVYVFTDAACVNGKAFGSAQQPCKQLAGAPVVAGEPAPVFVTALAGGVPAQLSASADTTVRMIFALSCINPATNAGVNANYAGVPLQLCTPNGGTPGSSSSQWSSFVNMMFKAGAPSVAANASFDYADVGKVQLYLRDTGTQIVASVPFVVKPASLALTEVTRTADAFLNPQAANGAGNGFAKAGEAFTIKAAALTKTGLVAPNFGNEGARLMLDAQRGGDAAVQAAMLDLPVLGGDFSAIVGGVFTGTAFSVDDAGIMALTPRLTNNDYLGAGPPASSVTTSVGRFYPDHFDTSTMVALQCLPNMNCPVNVSGAAYSGQAFAVTVKPMNAASAALRNYNGVLARPVSLSAWNLAGGATLNPSGGALSGNSIAAAAILPDLPIGAKPVYTLPQPFSSTASRARNWIAPTPVYLRASASENIAGGSAVVSSLRASGSVEGGVTIVSGRLALANPHGSELLKMPVKAEAQYWAATGRWETSATDNVSTVQSGGITFANCLKSFGPPCKTALLGVTADTSLLMKNGVATFWLRAPGAGNYGSAEFQMNNPTWLPSTIGRAVFGVYKSPLIYVREVY